MTDKLAIMKCKIGTSCIIIRLTLVLFNTSVIGRVRYEHRFTDSSVMAMTIVIHLINSKFTDSTLTLVIQRTSCSYLLVIFLICGTYSIGSDGDPL